MSDEQVTEEAPPEVPEGVYINLRVDQGGINYETNMDVEQVVFWLEATKYRVLFRAFEPQEETTDAQ